MKNIYLVDWQNNEIFAYTTERQAIAQVEAITGKPQKDWGWDGGDYDDNGNVVDYRKAVLM